MADDLTPLRKQYLSLKSQYPDSILFFRLGDFYETFDDDAELVARELGIVLTSRPSGKGQRVPLAGVPHHSVEGYVATLIERGYRVAIADQMADPSTVKGIVPREVTRVVTPGTVIEPGMLDEKRPNYLAAWVVDNGRVGLAHCDITTGEFAVTTLDSIQAAQQEIMRIAPRECLHPDSSAMPAMPAVLIHFTPIPDWRFETSNARQTLLDHFQTATLAGFGIDGQPLAIRAAGAICYYLRETQPGALAQLPSLHIYSTERFMTLDPATRRNLELTETMRDRKVQGSLLDVLDATRTGMGGRLLRAWLSQPLLDRDVLELRLDRVQAFFDATLVRAQTRETLKEMPDLERALGRVVSANATGRDLGAIRRALQLIPDLQRETASLAIGFELNPCSELRELLETAIEDDPTAPPGLIRPGFSAELDGILHSSHSAREWVANLERRERERTGIGSLKVAFNKVFGYYLEVTNPNRDKVPSDYIRKQTVSNAERYITPELKEYETIILNADERIVEVETRLFKELCARVSSRAQGLKQTAREIGQIDVAAGLAEVAALNNYTRPQLIDEDELEIRGGRHPVVEQTLPDRRFVPNDLKFDADARLFIITGPNMAGKCVRDDTLVFTDSGLVPIVCLQPRPLDEDTFASLRCRVKGLEGITHSTHFYSGGRHKTIRIRTRLGYELEGTPEHRILVRMSTGEEGWKALEEIAPGDVVAIDRQINLWGHCETLETPRAAGLKPRTTLKFYQLPRRLTPDLAYVIGLLVGDGSLREKNNLALTSADDFIAQEFSRIIQEQFGYRVGHTAKSKHFDLRLNSKQIRIFFEELGLEHVTAIEKSVPSILLKSPKPVVAAFLQGLFDTDGYADKKGGVSLSTSSQTLARQVHTLLLNFGIIASLNTKKGVRSVHPNYNISIYGAEALAFYREIGFRLPRKQAGVDRVSNLRMPDVGGIPHLAPALKRIQARIVSTSDKLTTLKSDRSIASIFYTYLPNARNISYRKLDELIEYCEHNHVAYPELEHLARRRYFYDPVVDVKSGEAPVFDLSVAKSHSFVANGFVNHNSTYLRQSALVALMAQVGSFVPAESVRMGLVDRIFTRIGAQDEIAAGQSTFMVEMVETANILHHASARSLIVLDEIGRGTSTYDGLSIAWAVVEYIHNHPRLRSKTLFATHYHELIALADHLPHVRNVNVAVAEEGDQIVFLHKIVAGGANRSYGIHVAQLAGLPKAAVHRAEELLEQLEQGEPTHAPSKSATTQQLALFTTENPLAEELKSIDVDALSPLEALTKLYELKKKAEGS